jgi:beta-aspartyl-peptidase (threonine type)
LRSHITAAQEKAYTQGLKDALLAGRNILSKGGSALLAAEAAVISLENCALFNAGRGSVFTAAESHEMEASIMCGQSGQAGAVAGLELIKNPIQVARQVMEDGRYVMLAGPGAQDFARHMGHSLEDKAYFHSDFRYKQLLAAKSSNEVVLDHDGERKFGTVGAVALDVNGNLAAATSTGGLTNKAYGRLGDSALIGAGTYANNNTCAVSCTGYGEHFIRGVVAYDISCLMEYRGLTLGQACQEVIMNKLKPAGGEGGVIALDKHGNISLTFNSEGMYRAWLSSADPALNTAIYK